MNKLIASYMLIFLLFSYFSSIAEGGGGIVATRLDGALTNTAITATVDSTVGYLAASSIIVDGEEMTYNGINAVQFLNLTRGHRGTEAVAHEDNAMAYSLETGVINRALGFNVVSTGEAYGNMAVINLTLNFLTQAIGYLVTFNFGLLGGQMIYVRYLLMSVAVGFVVYLGFMAMGTVFGILRR